MSKGLGRAYSKPFVLLVHSEVRHKLTSTYGIYSQGGTLSPIISSCPRSSNLMFLCAKDERWHGWSYKLKPICLQANWINAFNINSPLPLAIWINMQSWLESVLSVSAITFRFTRCEREVKLGNKACRAATWWVSLIEICLDTYGIDSLM